MIFTVALYYKAWLSHMTRFGGTVHHVELQTVDDAAEIARLHDLASKEEFCVKLETLNRYIITEPLLCF
jgi:hypothetical protein